MLQDSKALLQSNEASSIRNEIENVKYWPNEGEQVPLYIGSNQTVVGTLASQIAKFIDNNGYTKKLLERDIVDFEKTLPPGHNYPKSYVAAKRVLSEYILPKEVYDSCINDCVLFRDEYAKLEVCPVCNEKRFEPENGHQVKSARKKVTYLPLKHQLLKKFGEANVAKLVQAGDLELPKDRILRDFHHGNEWRSWFELGGVFHENREGAIPLSLTTDGLNPNRNPNIKRSMWPVLLGILGMKSKYRKLLGIGTLLVSIVPGYQGKEPKSLQPLLALIVDEILQLVDIRIYNAYIKAPMSMKISILHTVCDTPATSKVFETAGQAAIRACSLCTEEAIYSKGLKKCVHISNRRYLDNAHPLREADERFPMKGAITDMPPKSVDAKDEQEARDRFTELKVEAHRKQQLKQTGFLGNYALKKCPGHNRVTQNGPDPMHSQSDVCKHLMETVSGNISDRGKKYEIQIGRLTGSSLSESSEPPRKKRKISSKTKKTNSSVNEIQSEKLPHGPWELTKDGLKAADTRMLNITFTPTSCLSNKPYFTKNCQINKMIMYIKVQ